MNESTENGTRSTRRRRLALLALFLLLLSFVAGAVWVQDVVDGSDHAASLTPPPHALVPAGSTHSASISRANAASEGGSSYLTAEAPAPSQPASGFDVRGDATGLLYPGGAPSLIELVFHNPGSTPITVTNVTVSVGGTSAPRCSSDNFEIARQLSATPLVPAGATESLSDLGVPRSQWPAIQMLASGNQDACRTSTVSLAYAGTGRS
jgi:hypothetical protein